MFHFVPLEMLIHNKQHQQAAVLFVYQLLAVKLQYVSRDVLNMLSSLKILKGDMKADTSIKPWCRK